ncbi:caspase-1-like [Cloeon dipterum]|uniref:caspase-1-like n=1 Tax=Cloeon dipterum TaxID=197152 RepID=UPI0032200CB2
MGDKEKRTSSGKRKNLDSAQSDSSAQPSVSKRNCGNKDVLDSRLSISKSGARPISSVEVQSPVVDKYAKEYNMNHPRRGVALILNHVNFKKLEDREGSNKDSDSLKDVLKKLGFEVRVVKDLDFSGVMDTLENLSQEDHSQNDCLVVAVLTHGSSGKLEASDYNYNVENLWENFTADKCPSLAGKPKIFFIQACRGDNVDSATALKCTNTSDQTGADELDASAGSLCYTIPNNADFLFANATMEGYSAWRSKDNGTWFIQQLCNQLEKHHEEHDLQTILTFVSCSVAVDYESNVPDNESMHKKKQIPCMVSMLTRLVYFRSKNPIEMMVE